MCPHGEVWSRGRGVTIVFIFSVLPSCFCVCGWMVVLRERERLCVWCSPYGNLFCKLCLLENLNTQKKSIKRAMKAYEQQIAKLEVGLGCRPRDDAFTSTRSAARGMLFSFKLYFLAFCCALCALLFVLLCCDSHCVSDSWSVVIGVVSCPAFCCGSCAPPPTVGCLGARCGVGAAACGAVQCLGGQCQGVTVCVRVPAGGRL